MFLELVCACFGFQTDSAACYLQPPVHHPYPQCAYVSTEAVVSTVAGSYQPHNNPTGGHSFAPPLSLSSLFLSSVAGGNGQLNGSTFGARAQDLAGALGLGGGGQFRGRMDGGALCSGRGSGQHEGPAASLHMRRIDSRRGWIVWAGFHPIDLL